MRKLNAVQKPQVMMKVPSALISEELREVHYGQFLIDKQGDTEIYFT